MAQDAFYLNMGLPVYVRAVDSNSFAASVVKQGHALLFYNGTRLKAKLPSGSVIDVGGSSSTDFSIVTATADDVLAPKQFYNNQGAPTTGNIQTVTATLVGNTVHIPKGYIAASDSITVSGGGGDVDVTLGVIDANGKFQPLKFNGTEASNSGSAQSVSSYKSWNSTLPAPAPEPGGGINIPTSNLIFYAPLSSDSDSAVTGQILTTSGTVTYSTQSGVPSATFGNNSYISFPDAALAVGAAARTISLWAYCNSTGSIFGMFNYGVGQGDQDLGIFFDARSTYNINCGSSDTDVTRLYNVSIYNTWHNIIFVYDGTSMKLYIDGLLVGYKNVTLDTTLNGTAYIGTLTPQDYPFHGNIAGVRIYDRAVTRAQIMALASEFAPTA